MDSDKILDEAPVSKAYGFKLAFVCVGCPSWFSNWDVPDKDDKGRLLCTTCGGMLKLLPLEAFLMSSREESPEHFDGLLRAHVGSNPGVRGEAK
jgi:hypothetical protein